MLIPRSKFLSVLKIDKFLKLVPQKQSSAKIAGFSRIDIFISGIETLFLGRSGWKRDKLLQKLFPEYHRAQGLFFHARASVEWCSDRVWTQSHRSLSLRRGSPFGECTRCFGRAVPHMLETLNSLNTAVAMNGFQARYPLYYLHR